MIGVKLRSIAEDRSTAETAPQRVTLQVNLIVRDCSLVGVFNDHIEIQFRNAIASRNFVICRTIRAEVGNREELEKLKPKTEYQKLPPKPAPVIEAEVMEAVELLRLNAATQDYETLQPPELKQFHKDFGLIQPDPESDGMRFHYPNLQTVLKFKVVVTTCVTAGVPSGLGVKPGHFDWITIDEVGQAAEPEGHWDTRRAAYAFDGIDDLRRNFRNHPSILQFPNEQFYSGDLEAGADPITTTRFVGGYKMPNPNSPSSSMGSPVKTNGRARCLRTSIRTKFWRSKSKDIGIIAPYSAQCSKIRSTLAGHRYQDIKVGSVEEFQGQKRPIIIISTTREARRRT
ncbi:hypothetical protein FRC04_011461 [Tulasnella sp. 424]|nr:hypothetical protein FRC04_011461 [Tulasnella sp. 424]